MRRLFLVAVLVFAGTGVWAQTPDGETPADEGVCDDLMWGTTPGLYGLCVAFCEAQDCEPDWTVEDPFENCSPSNPKLLEIYNKKKQPSDPGMPCVKYPCPCWTAEELQGLRAPQLGDTAWCYTPPGKDQWTVLLPLTPPCPCTTYGTGVGAVDSAYLYCQLWDRCNPQSDSCLNEYRHIRLTPEEYATCVDDVVSSGQARGFTCWD